ncbi:MAG TPA: hypothetical protein PK952_05705 [Chitinophagales bacterium]|nr:hypothetical protein [Chitinophagales bacterium]
MTFIEKINKIITQYIIRKASKNKAVDIVEVRTKQLGLLSVVNETDLCIKNTLFIPYRLLSIETDLLNKDGIKVGKMSYDKPIRVKGNAEVVFTTVSEISIITSFFQALSNLLSQPIWMRSVGIAKVKVLWWTIDLPIDDVFEIQTSKIKIIPTETEEERQLRIASNEIKKQQRAAEKEEKKIKKEENRAERKENILKRRHKENYIPKEQREILNDTFEDASVDENIELETSVNMENATQQTSEPLANTNDTAQTSKTESTDDIADNT